MWEEGTTCLWCHLERSKAMARDSELLERPILGGRFTVGLRMVWFTGHNTYHLGRASHGRLRK